MTFPKKAKPLLTDYTPDGLRRRQQGPVNPPTRGWSFARNVREFVRLPRVRRRARQAFVVTGAFFSFAAQSLALSRDATAQTLAFTIAVFARPLQGGGGSGAAASALDSPSTVVYNPEEVAAGLEVTLPQVWLDTRYNQGGAALTFTSDITLSDTANAVTNMANLQSAVDDSLTLAGHSRIKLPNSFVASGTLRLGVHTQGNYWTYIQRSSLGTEGTRATQAQLATAPIIRTTNSNRGAVEFAPGADHWRFDDVVFDSTAAVTQVIVQCGPVDVNGDNAGTTVNDLPNFVYFSRCWIKGRASGEILNGLYLNARSAAFVDGIIENIFREGFESHAIGVFNGRGPFKIVNNYLEGGSITVLFGGADPFITGFAPQDVEFRRNQLSMRDSWNIFHATYDGKYRALKNRLEFKYGIRVLVEGNIIEKSPLQGQFGEAFVIKSMAGESGNLGDASSWYKTQDICIRYNVCRELWNWLNILGVQMPHLETLGGVDRVALSHNLIYNYADTRYGDNDASFGVFVGSGTLGGPTNVQLHHITAIPRAASMTQYSPRAAMWTPDVGADKVPGLRILDSILHSGRYELNRWAFTNSGPDGEAELDRITGGDFAIQNSFLIDGPSGVWASGEMSLVASIAAMNFTGDDPSLGLDSDSPAKNAASDGTDAGCNYTKVNLATSGVAS